MLPEIVLFTKSGGPLTKQISLAEDGRLKSDGSACTMSIGTAQRMPMPDVDRLGALIGAMRPDQAIALGALRTDLPDEVGIVTKRKLMNGSSPRHVIARSQDYIDFRTGQPGYVLLDYDTKGMPDHVRQRLDEVGGFWQALISVIPDLDTIALVARRSTSSGLYRTDTDEDVPGSQGWHVYLAVKDAADSERFLKTLHQRCWLGGYGWMMVGAGGQFLERSIVDRMVGSPERLVFEGAPILTPPLAQDPEKRKPIVRGDDTMDTKAKCPPLNVEEKDKFYRYCAKEKQRLSGEAARAREEFIARQAKKIVGRTSVSHHAATATVRKWCDGVLLPDVVLPFDDPEFAGKTVADVLADPNTFVGETLADPLEGVEYGAGKAMIMRRADGSVWINSFAHGCTVYELKLDAVAIRLALTKAAKEDVVLILVDLLLRADVNPTDEEDLVHQSSKQSGIGFRAIQKRLKDAKKEKAAKERAAELERTMAESNDPRPRIPVPVQNAPTLPVMDTLNSIHGGADERIPPARDLHNDSATARTIKIPKVHAFATANEKEQKP